MIISRTPRILAHLARNLTWHLDGEGKSVYLTFDDGPTPEVTPWVLDRLDEANAKATFFMLGKNARAHPDIHAEVLRRGHAVGNHSNDHVKGFRTPLEDYLANVEKASEVLDTRLFRPPYGRILRSQARALKTEYRIIMWDVLSVDYNRKLKVDTVVRNVTAHVRPGSIIVFHDSVKASKNLYGALPRVLEFLNSEGYTCIPIPQPPAKSR